MESCSLEDIALHFQQKSSLIKSCVELRNLDHESCSLLPSLEEVIDEVKQNLHSIRCEIEKGKSDLHKLQGLFEKIQAINCKVNYAESNFPPALQVQKDAARMEKDKPSNVVKASKPLPSKSNKPPKIAAITDDEFESLPKYMRGRLTCNALQNFVAAFNKTIAAKYTFLSTPRNQLGNTDFRKFQVMKRQEIKETKGMFFCVMEDLKTFGNIKSDNSAKSMIIILRHCSRIKEVRGPASIVRYTVITS